MIKKTTRFIALLISLIAVSSHCLSLQAEGVSGYVFVSIPGDIPETGQLGTDVSTGFQELYTPYTKVEPGKAVKYQFKAITSGIQTYDCPIYALANAEKTNITFCRNDNWGWGPGYDDNFNLVRESNWNWGTYLSDINEAQHEVYIYNRGNNLADVYLHVTTTSGTKYFQYFKNIVVDSDDLYAAITCDKSYLIFDDITSAQSFPTEIINGVVPDTYQLAKDTTTIYGSVTTPETKLTAGQAVQYTFSVKSLSMANWQSALYIIKEEGDREFKDYIIGRNDHYIFGDIPAGSAITLQSNWNWDEFIKDLNDAKITATIMNLGNNTAEIHISYIGGSTGNIHYQEFRNIPFKGDYFYTMLSCEKSYLIFDKPEDGSQTAITNPEEAADVVNTQYFNLLGVAVDKDYKGIVIKVEKLSDGTNRITKSLK